MKKRLLPLLIIAMAVSGLQAQDAASKIGINRTWISLNSEPEKAMDSLFQVNDSPVIVPSSLKTLDYATSSYEKDSLHSKHEHRLGIYPELAGNGMLFSGNLEYTFLFKDRTRGVYIRGGKGGHDLQGSTTLIESGFLIGKGNKYFDVGFGYTRFDYNSYEYEVYAYALRLGYRYQGKKGFLFRLAPLITRKFEPDGDEYYFWFGIGLGYSFQLNK